LSVDNLRKARRFDRAERDLFCSETDECAALRLSKLSNSIGGLEHTNDIEEKQFGISGRSESLARPRSSDDTLFCGNRRQTV
jgi:hypothetical protein